MDVKIHRIFDFGLGEELSLYQGRLPRQRATEAWNKEERIIRNTRQGLDLTKAWNTAVGGDGINNAASSLLFSFFHVLVVWGCLLICVVFCPLWNILQSVLARRSALVPVFLFPELLWSSTDVLGCGWARAANYQPRPLYCVCIYTVHVLLSSLKHTTGWLWLLQKGTIKKQFHAYTLGISNSEHATDSPTCF